jgi:DNA-binding XRE family transcriptional regulator
MNAITPIAMTKDTVTLSRVDYDSLLEALEDARDIAKIHAVETAVAAGETEYIPVDMAERLLAGEHPLRVWREHRGLTGSALAKLAGVPQSYVSEIENGRKPGSFDAMTKLARALNVSLDDLAQGG